MKRYAILVAALAVVAGCTTGPPEPTSTTVGSETFEVRLTGNSSATYVVTADLVADPFESVTVTYANGTSQPIPAPARQTAVTYGPESGVTGVEFTGDTVGGVHFEGSPTFSVTDEGVPATGNVVYAVRREGDAVLAAWGLIRCGGHVSDLSLVTNETGITGVGFECRS